jgi:hypothetical protein
MDNYCYLTITPISRDSKSASYIDYNEQLSRVLNDGFRWCWDDSRYNKAKIGEYFAFYFHGMRVVIHKIMDVKPPSQRLPSWSKNVGQGDRNILELSEPLIEISWVEWQMLQAPESKMGTYTTCDLSIDRPRLYEYLKNVLESKNNSNANKITNIQLIFENDENKDLLSEIEEEEQLLLNRLEKIQKIKKVHKLQEQKNNLLEQKNNILEQIKNIDAEIQILNSNN